MEYLGLRWLAQGRLLGLVSIRRGLCSAALVLASTNACRVFDAPDPNTPRAADAIWQIALPCLGPPALDDSAVYFALRDHRIVALSRATGTIQWATYSGQAGSSVITEETPVRATAVVVFGDEYLYGLEPTTGQLRWVFGKTGGTEARVGIYPFKTDGPRVFAGSAVGSAFGVDAASGAQLWRTDLVPGVGNQVRVMAIVSGIVFVSVNYNGLAFAGRVYALDALTGATIWSYELPRPDGSANGIADVMFTADPSVGSLLAISFRDGRIVGLNPMTGMVRWTIPRLLTLTTTDDDRRLSASAGVLVANAESPDAIEGYDLATGVKRWRVLSDQGSTSGGFGMVSSDNELAYVNFTNGYIGAYDLQTGIRRSVRTAPSGFFVDAPLISRDTLFVGGYLAAFAIRR